MEFWTLDTVTGSGKTDGIIGYAADRIPLGLKFVIAQPSRQLARKSYAAACRKYPDLRKNIKLITSDTSPGQVSADLTDLTIQIGDEGCLLFITQAAFERSGYWHNKQDWHLCIDEPMNVVFHRHLRLAKHRKLIEELFEPIGIAGDYTIIQPTNVARIESHLRFVERDDIIKHFADLYDRLRLPYWKLYVDTENYQQFLKTGKPFNIFGMMGIELFKGFASVTLMAANLNNSFMARHFKALGCTFKPHKAIMKTLRYVEHDNGHRLHIYHLSDRPWSKKLRDTMIEIGNGELMSIGEIYRDEIGKLFRSQPYLVMKNLDVDGFDFVGGTVLPNDPRGLNTLQDFHNVAVYSALNPQPAHRKFLEHICQMTKREMTRAMLSESAYQALGRSSLRNPTCDEPVTICVPDRNTADDIAKMYPGCHRHLIGESTTDHTDETGQQTHELAQIDDVTPPSIIRQFVTKNPGETGRPKIYADQAEKQAAYRERKKAQADLNEVMAGLITDSPITETGGFSLTMFDSHRDPQGRSLNQAMPTSEFFTLMTRMAKNQFSKKHQNKLMAPTIFAKGRKSVDALAHLGILLDFDHTQIHPDQIKDLFPDLTMILYSSFGHTKTEWKYRVCIPTTQYMTPDNAVLIREVLISQIEQRGFTPLEHGVDHTKVNASAIFYFPSSTPDSFVTLIDSDQRKPLVPDEWLDRAPVIEPPTPQPIQQLPFSSGLTRDRRIEGAINKFMETGTLKGRGRSKLFGLAKSLKEIGCEPYEMRAILHSVAGQTHNPTERRSEIDSLIR